jgi:putative spermidine/putrescine transport system ATP-binding protein
MHLQLQHLSKKYGGFTAVDEFSLAIADGEFVSFLGASGSGKTTTLMMIAGFTPPDTGRIVLAGDDITYRPPSDRNIGVVFQNYALFPHMSVSENVAYPLRVRRRPRSEILESVNRALDMVQLSRFGEYRPSQLSGGQQQRVALARSIVFEPKLLLMDEPLGALDKNLREQMKLEIKGLQERLGITVIYVTHDQEEALTMSHRVALLDTGQLLQVGTPRELYTRPANRFVAEFIGEASFLDGTVEDGNGLRLPDGQTIRFRRKANRNVEHTTVMIRPEAVKILDAMSEDQNILSATVEDVVYLGPATRYLVRTPGNQCLLIKVPMSSQMPEYRAGDRVSLGWHSDDTQEI